MEPIVACCDTSLRGAETAFGSGRSTPQRRAIAETVSALDAAFTAEDLAARVRRAHPGISTATLYRSITAMASTGFIVPVGERAGAVLYAPCGSSEHHHHVVCTSCGATAHTPCPLLSAGVASATPDGFVVTSHEVRLYGLCAACAASAKG